MNVEVAVDAYFAAQALRSVAGYGPAHRIPVQEIKSCNRGGEDHNQHDSRAYNPFHPYAQKTLVPMNQHRDMASCFNR